MKIAYNRGKEIIEIRVLDETGAKQHIEKFNKSDKIANAKAMKSLKEKYGWEPAVPLEGSVNLKDHNWLDPDNDFLGF